MKYSENINDYYIHVYIEKQIENTISLSSVHSYEEHDAVTRYIIILLTNLPLTVVVIHFRKYEPSWNIKYK